MAVNLFDANYYRKANADLAGSDTQLQEHFQQYGLKEGRSFSPFADLNFYRASNSKDLGNFSNQEAYDHLQKYGITEGRTFTRFVDLNFYKSANGDLAGKLSKDDNLEGYFEHLQQYGSAEGRTFSQYFNPDYYRRTNTDLPSFNNRQLLEHLEQYGLDQGRNFSADFDANYYRNANSDLAAVGLNNKQLYNHFRLYGIAETRESSPIFSVKSYLQDANNADLRSLNPTQAHEHFNLYGYKEGRFGCADYAGNTLGSARAIDPSSSNVTFKDFVGANDTDDYYRFTLTKPVSGSVILDGLGANANVEMIADANNNGRVDENEVIKSSNNSPTNKDVFSGILNPGTYYIRVNRSETANTSYQLKVSTTDKLPNNAPIATALTQTGDEDTDITLKLVGSDVDGDKLTVTTDGTSQQGGSISQNEDGSFTYKPKANFNGEDSFNYTVSDGKDGTSSAKVSITVNPVNDAPVATALTQSGDEDTEITLNLVGSDVDEDTLTITTDATSKEGGAIAQNEDGSFTYKPKANFNGTDEFNYTVSDGKDGTSTQKVTITVNSVNDAPVVTALTQSGDEDTEIKLNLVGSDVDEDTLTITTDATSKEGGAIAQNEDGSFTYKPKANFNGTDEFNYTVSDGKDGTSTQKVSITVNSVNDAPVATALTQTGDEDTDITLKLVGNDVDEDKLTVTTDGTSQQGGKIAQNEDGSFTYKPKANFNGTDEFNYTVSDGKDGTSTQKVTITVNSVNDAPVVTALTQSGDEDTEIKLNLVGSDVDEDKLTVTTDGTSQQGGSISQNEDGSFTYKPKANFNGEDSFNYTVDDGKGGTSTQTVSITVNSVNDNPLATALTQSGDEDTEIKLNLVGSDVDEDTLTITTDATSKEGGAIARNEDGSFTYKPKANFNGTDEFNYTVDDGKGGTSSAKVSITVNSVNDAPIVAYTKTSPVNFTEGDQQVAFIDIANLSITDVDNDNLQTATVEISTPQSGDTLAIDLSTLTDTNISVDSTSTDSKLVLKGEATLDNYQAALGSVTYNNTLQNPDQTARQITFTINDGSAESQNATSTVAVTAVNDAPVVDLNGSATGIDYTTSFNIGRGAVAVVDKDNLSSIDIDQDSLASATVRIVNQINSSDEELAADTEGTNITASYDAASDTLSLTGTDTAAHYQQVLRSVTYNNNSVNPTTTERTIQFTINDGKVDSGIATSTVNVNNPSVLDLNGSGNGINYSASFTEDGGAVSIVDKTNLDVTDANNSKLTSASIKIDNLQADDVLAVVTDGTSITANYNSTTGVLSLSGEDTLANYENVLRSVTYNNTSQNPNKTARQIKFTINDGIANSDVATSTVSVTAINDTPTIDLNGSAVDGNDYTASFTEDGQPVAIVDSANLSITDDDTQIQTATVKINNLKNGSNEVLAATNTGSIQSNYDSNTGELTLTGDDILANYRTVLRSVTYSNTSQNPDTTAREITFKINDGTIDSAVATSTVSVTAVNDAPVVDLNGSATGIDYSSAIFSTGRGAVPVVDSTNLSITDVDNTTLKSATVRIDAPINVNNEKLEAITTNSGITSTYNSTTGTLTLTGDVDVATYKQVLGSVTYNNTSLNPTTTTRNIKFTINDGTTNSAIATSTVSINKPPAVDLNGSATGIDYNSATFTEDGGAVAIVDTNLTVTDANNTKLKSATVKIDNLKNGSNEVLAATNTGSITSTYDSTNGTLTLTGDDILANYQKVLRTVTYNNTAQNPDTTARQIKFTLNDGITNSDVATSTVTVTAVNDAPVVAVNNSSNPSFTEDGSPAVVAANHSITDVDNTQIQTATVKINNLRNGSNEVLDATINSGIPISKSYDAATGTLTLTATGTATLANYQTVLRSVTYNNTSQNPDTTAREIQFTIKDGTIDSNTATSTVAVNAVNDAPVVAVNNSSNPSFTEDGSPAVVAANLGITDVDNTQINSATVRITNQPNGSDEVLAATNTGSITSTYDSTNGTLTLTGVDTLANYQTVLRSVTYNNTSQNPGTAARQIQFTINDGTDNSVVATSTVTVIAVNDAPIMSTNSPKSISSVTSTTLYPLTNVNLKATDPDNTPGALTYKIVSKPQNGTVRLPNPFTSGTYDVTTVNSTFTQADIDSGRLTYRSNNGSNDSFTFQISDGLGKTNDQIFTFNIKSST